MAKQMIVDAVTERVERFDIKRKTCLATDWSNSGIGFFLMEYQGSASSQGRELQTCGDLDHLQRAARTRASPQGQLRR